MNGILSYVWLERKCFISTMYLELIYITKGKHLLFYVQVSNMQIVFNISNH